MKINLTFKADSHQEEYVIDSFNVEDNILILFDESGDETDEVELNDLTAFAVELSSSE